MSRPKASRARRRIGTPARVALVEVRRQPVQQQVGRAGCAAAAAAPHRQRGPPRSTPPPGLASRPANIAAESASRYVARASSARSARGAWRLGPAAAGRRDPRRVDESELGPQELDLGLLEFGERPGFSHGQQVERRVERARLEFRACAAASARAGPLRRVRASAPRPVRGRRPPRPAHLARGPGPLDRSSSPATVLVRTGRGLGEMPGSPIGVDGRIGDLGQGAVRLAGVRRSRLAIDRRAHQRMAEA